MAFREDPFEGQFSPADIKSLANQDTQIQKQQQSTAVAPDKAPAQPPIKQKLNTTMLGEPADVVVINPSDKRLDEQFDRKSDTIVVLNGRMNPVTKGHEENVKGMHKIAKAANADHILIASHSHDQKKVGAVNKNPLSPEQKLKHLKRAFPDTNITTTSTESPSIFHQMAKLHQQGYKHVILAAGEDRTEDYDRIKQYNGVEGKHGYYNFKSIGVESTGERKKGISGTDMRKYAENNDYNKFKANLPTNIAANDQYAQDLYHDTRHGMRVDENVHMDGELLVEAVVSLQQRMRRAVTMRKNKARLTRARNIARKRMAGKKQLSRRAMKRAKNILRQRLAGSQGAKYKNLSKAQKISVDKMVERRKKAIKRIAVKLAPRIRSDELKRLSAVQQGKSFRTTRMPVVASFDLTNKEDKYLTEKATSTGLDYQTLLQVFNRGKVAWNKDKPPGKTPSQYAFNRLNSYIQGGKAFKEDVDLRENMGTTVRDILAKGMRTARMMDKVDPEHIPNIHPSHMQADAKKGEDDVVARRKRAALIRTKTKEYVTKVIDEQRINNHTTAPSLKATVEHMLGGCGCEQEEDHIYEEMTWEQWTQLVEENNEGRTLNKPFRTTGGPKKFAVYVKNDKGNVIKLGFGDPNLEIKRDDPDRRRAYRARHGCDNPGPKWKANYWSCNWSWSASKKVGA